MCLGACTNSPKPVLVAPPAHLLEDCKRTDLDLATNGDLIRQIRAYRADIDVCNADKGSLRKWAADMGAP